jgi:hypothetical protein
VLAWLKQENSKMRRIRDQLLNLAAQQGLYLNKWKHSPAAQQGLYLNTGNILKGAAGMSKYHVKFANIWEISISARQRSSSGWS